MSPRRNELEMAAERVAESLGHMGTRPGQRPAVEFGLEMVSMRDKANRMFGPQSSPAIRKAELERVGPEEMVKLARTYQEQHKWRNLVPRKGARNG